jgi:hypothetical protein
MNGEVLIGVHVDLLDLEVPRQGLAHFWMEEMSER